MASDQEKVLEKEYSTSEQYSKEQSKFGKDIYICFIDYCKAFDKVKHSKMIECLKEIGLDGKDLDIITKLFWDQTAAVRTESP